MTESKKNSAASIHQRLLHIARTRGYEFQPLLTRFAIERLLVRLASTVHRNEFVLKGAMLFALWSDEPHRPTVDLDLLGRGSPDFARLREIFEAVCTVARDDDAIRFDPTSIQVAAIREDAVYEGVRVRVVATLGKARIPIQIDVGFGDAVVPRPTTIEYPVLLDLPAPRIRAYARETVVAEKTEAMIVLGIANSQMKDFFDLWFLAENFEFEGARLTDALRSTLRRRKTDVPLETPLALTEQFAKDSTKRKQWSAFVTKHRLRVEPPDFDTLISFLRAFLTPLLEAIRGRLSFDSTWKPRGPWVQPAK